MEVSGDLHVLSHQPRKQRMIHTGHYHVWTPVPVWTLSRREKSLSSTQWLDFSQSPVKFKLNLSQYGLDICPPYFVSVVHRLNTCHCFPFCFSYAFRLLQLAIVRESKLKSRTHRNLRWIYNTIVLPSEMCTYTLILVRF
jgi:hypothetical protein